MPMAMVVTHTCDILASSMSNGLSISTFTVPIIRPYPLVFALPSHTSPPPITLLPE